MTVTAVRDGDRVRVVIEGPASKVTASAFWVDGNVIHRPSQYLDEVCVVKRASPMVGDITPTAPWHQTPPGTIITDLSSRRMYVREGDGGTWRFVAMGANRAGWGYRIDYLPPAD